jgi:DNA-binding NarL/FixJ family response regulator
VGRGMDPLRVILVDDSALFRQGLAGLLAPAGVQVSAQAATADEALVRIAAHRPDVVIMDIRMPPTYTDEGLQATAQLKKPTRILVSCCCPRTSRRPPQRGSSRSTTAASATC